MTKDTANKVLLAVCAVAKPGEYVILNRAELASNLPLDYKDEEVDKAMMQLQADDYVSVRYSDSDVYCLSVLTKGFVYGEKLKEYEEKKREEAAAKENAAHQQGDVSGALQSPEAAATIDETEKAVAVVPQEVKFPWKKLFLACVGGAFLGGVIAGVIAVLLAKLI